MEIGRILWQASAAYQGCFSKREPLDLFTTHLLRREPEYGGVRKEAAAQPEKP